jgi:uncharacterized RDD family membrane protein YckC
MIKPTMRGLLAAVIPVLFGALAGIAQAQSAASDADSADDSDQSTHVEHHRVRLHHGHHDGNDNNLFSIGSDSVLPAGKQADSVVAILGAAISDGDADSVVSILGSTHVTGPLSDSAVAVLGNVYVDSKIDGDAVAVLGNIELGPHAEIGGDVVAVGGKLQRDPDAILHGEAQTVLGGDFGGFDWIKPWIRHCLFLGRPLALVPGIGWAWTLALSFLGLYVLLAFLFRSGLDQCVRTFESYPGHCIVAALIAALVSPIIITLLCITVIGIAAVPFVVAGLFFAGLFGKVVLLAWIGGRFIGRPQPESPGHAALAVLLGGIVVLVLYLVPVLGFIVYKLLGLLGFGAVVYTLLQLLRARRAAAAAADVSADVGVASVASADAGLGASPPPPLAAAAAAAAAAATAAPATPPPSATPQSAESVAIAAARAASLPRAGFWIRIVALLLDALAVGIVVHIFHHKADVELLLLAIYGAVMWKLRGATVGGIVFDMQVVRLDGREIDWVTSFVRALSCFLSLAPAGLGFLWIAFDSEKQAWHDKIAGTVVVRTRQRLSPV